MDSLSNKTEFFAGANGWTQIASALLNALVLEFALSSVVDVN